MRRGFGVGAVERRTQTQKSFKEIGEITSKTEIEKLQSQFDTFYNVLQTFAHKHRKEILRDPEFRMHFQKMCANIGVDPLASTKGIWSDLLGVGDFYFELAIQIIDVCLATREQNGGIIPLEEVIRRVSILRERANKAILSNSIGNKEFLQQITKDDVIRAIKTLKPLGNGFEIFTLSMDKIGGNNLPTFYGRQMVRSIPKELSLDISIILAISESTPNNIITRSYLMKKLNWSFERTHQALKELLMQGLCWVDMQALSLNGEEEYWIPTFFDGGRGLT